MIHYIETLKDFFVRDIHLNFQDTILNDESEDDSGEFHVKIDSFI